MGAASGEATTGRVLWEPSPERAKATRIRRFAEALGKELGQPLDDYAALHRASLEHTEAFWSALWRELGMISEGSVTPVLPRYTSMQKASWFPDVRLNFAENLLRRDDDAIAIVARTNTGGRQTVTFRELRRQVTAVFGWLRERGVKPGDRVAGILVNGVPAVVAMLATSALGAIWSLCAPDLGTAALVDRFGQIEPRVLVATPGAAPRADPLRRVRALLERLPSVEHVLLVGAAGADAGAIGAASASVWEDVLQKEAPSPLAFTRLPFAAPAFVLYTSGTTGPPKCIVHGMGGMLLQLGKELALHYDVRHGERFFYHTSPGWNMWYWVVIALGQGASVVLWDGSPVLPRASALLDLADEEGIDVFGVSPAYLAMLRGAQLEPRRTHGLHTVRTILSTGSPLSPELYDWVYEHMKADVCLSSISGGTEINACFGTGNPAGPVRRGEMQVIALGMKVEVWGDDGVALAPAEGSNEGALGELVATAPFPSQPVGFWNDPEDRRYHETYFARFPGVWHHGDLARITPSGGLVILGRSDATLKPGGHRIGTAEIYRVVEELPEIETSIAVGQRWEDDVRIVLFVVLRTPTTPSPGGAAGRKDEHSSSVGPELEGRIRQHLARSASPLHVPSRIVRVADIPRTHNGKKAELAVRAVIHGEPVRNESSLANPEALALYRDLEALRS